jgi:hypothetical protein
MDPKKRCMTVGAKRSFYAMDRKAEWFGSIKTRARNIWSDATSFEVLAVYLALWRWGRRLLQLILRRC